jgi:GMP synthase-like glutamine amidotransferase
VGPDYGNVNAAGFSHSALSLALADPDFRKEWARGPLSSPAPCREAMTSCLVVQHLAPESAWAIGDALANAGIIVDVRRADLGDPIPTSVADHDGLVVMGGPMSATSDDGFVTRRAELALLSDAVTSGRPTLGVCLGAQLLTLAAGGRVRTGENGPEVGWAPVELSTAAGTDPLVAGLPRHIDVLHWHGDTYEQPTGAVHLASSERYRNQAFRVGEAAWGLQFHLEVTTEAVDAFVDAFAEEAGCAPGGAAVLRRATPRRLEQLRPWQELVFDRFAALVVGVHGDESRDRFANISTP